MKESLKQKKLWAMLIFAMWLGLVMGLSFIETPLKFQAPGITRELGLGIGRLVFGILNKIELILLFLSLIFSFKILCKPKSDLLFFSLMLIVSLILLLQTFFLLPELDERAEKIISGHSFEPSNLHTFFIVLELLKLPSLTLLFFARYSAK